MYPTQAGRRIFHHAPTTCSSSTFESSSSEGSVESVGTVLELVKDIKRRQELL